MLPEPKMSVADTISRIDETVREGNRRATALLATDLDDALLLSGSFGEAFPSLMALLKSSEFRASAAAWQILRTVSGHANALTDEERLALMPIVHDLASAKDELTAHIAYVLYGHLSQEECWSSGRR